MTKICVGLRESDWRDGHNYFLLSSWIIATETFHVIVDQPVHEMVETDSDQMLAWAHSRCTLLAKVSSSTLQAAEPTAHQAGEKQSPTEEGTVDDLSCCHFLKLHVAGKVSRKYRTELDWLNRWSDVMCL